LEVGCGEGLFRKNVAHVSHYWGIEPDPVSARKAAALLDCVWTGTFDAVQGDLPANHFDLVVCNDVIEHMADPWLFLDSLRAKMAPGSFLVGSFPNVRYVGNLVEVIFLKEWRYTDEGILDRTHLRFFTAKSFSRLLRESGFVIEKMKGINPAAAKGSWKRAIGAGVLRCLGPLVGDIRFPQFGFRARLA
jgi:2-polyprenyl-3-methyl-5-hydroxy-6-metoxy-1,4-benzoquinol methylase